MPALSVVFSVSADGRSVAEALVEDASEAAALLAAAREAGSDLAWAHAEADLSALGFRQTWGYRRLEGPSAGVGSDGGPARAGQPSDVRPLPATEDSAQLWAEAFRGQWGHKTPGQWPLDLPPGTITLALRRNGRPVGVCRVEPDTGLIDGPGLVAECRDAAGYASLLAAALAAVRTSSATLESWGDGPDRVEVCERFGLVTAQYRPGWESDLRS
jgi:hypothetical protein